MKIQYVIQGKYDFECGPNWEDTFKNSFLLERDAWKYALKLAKTCQIEYRVIQRETILKEETKDTIL